MTEFLIPASPPDFCTVDFTHVEISDSFVSLRNLFLKKRGLSESHLE